MRRRCFLSFSLACAAILFSCSQDQAAPIPAKRQQAQAPAQELSLPKATLSASCIFVEGYVERGRNGSWQELEIGDSIEAQDSVRTGPDGSCEIQFGGSAMLRIQPSTLYMLDSVALSAELNRVEGSLAIGTVLNKVNKLSGKDSYMVRTDTSVAGVRGTDFMVSNDSVRGTTVSVKAGAVAVLPVSPVVYELLAASSTNAAAAAAVEAIVSSARIVAANQEITVDKAAAEEARIVHQEIAQEIAAISPEALEALAKSLPEAAGSAAQVAAPSSLAAAPLITAGNATFTGSTLSVAILAEKAEASDNASLKAAYASLKRIADTAAARIDTPAPVSIPSQSPVLESFKLIDTMQPAAAVPVREESKVAPADPVSLIAPSTGAPAASAAAPASATGAKAPAATSAPAVPGPAVPAMGQPASGSQQSPAVAATAQVQAPKREFIISSWDVLKNPVAGNVVRMPAGDVFVLSDPRGNLSAVSPTGKLLWSMETQNKGAELMSPVPFKGVVYYSGSNELVAVDAQSGRKLYSVALEGDRSHVLGNRVVPFADFIAFPTMAGLDIMDPRTGTVLRSIPVPDGTMMSPANYEGMAAIVNQKGVFMLIDLASGELRAQVQTGARQPVALAPRIYGSLACFADRKGLLVMVDLSTMSVAWERALPVQGGVFSDVEIGPEGVVAYAKQTVFAYRLDGNPILEPIRGVSAPPLMSRGVLYYGTEDGFLVALRLSPPGEIGRIALGAKLSARPLFADGALFVGTAAGKLLKVDPAKIAP